MEQDEILTVRLKCFTKITQKIHMRYWYCIRNLGNLLNLLLNWQIFNKFLFIVNYGKKLVNTVGIYLFKVNNRNTKKKVWNIKTVYFLYFQPWAYFTSCSTVFIAEFEHMTASCQLGIFKINYIMPIVSKMAKRTLRIL